MHSDHYFHGRILDRHASFCGILEFLGKLDCDGAVVIFNHREIIFKDGTVGLMWLTYSFDCLFHRVLNLTIFFPNEHDVSWSHTILKICSKSECNPSCIKLVVPIKDNHSIHYVILSVPLQVGAHSLWSKEGKVDTSIVVLSMSVFGHHRQQQCH